MSLSSSCLGPRDTMATATLVLVVLCTDEVGGITADTVQSYTQNVQWLAWESSSRHHC